MKLPKIASVPLLLAVLTTGCGTSPRSLAESHLEAIKTGNASKANQQYCNPTETLELHTVKSFEILSSQDKNRDNLPYTEVTAKIDTDQYRFKNVTSNGITVPQQEVLQQVTIEVWKSDNFYQEVLISTAKLNDLGKSTAALTGIPQKTMDVPARDTVSKNDLCVFLPYEQFDSDK